MIRTEVNIRGHGSCVLLMKLGETFYCCCYSGGPSRVTRIKSKKNFTFCLVFMDSLVQVLPSGCFGELDPF